MSRYIPITIAIVVIASLTVVEGFMSERWGDSRLCAYCATLLEEVPSDIGGWTSTSNDVDDDTREVAGARGWVSRTYTNPDTDEAVAVWLIVGHARDTARHTPDVCYTSQGNTRETDITRHALDLEDGSRAEFFTAVFNVQGELGVLPQRVFWAWFKPKGDADAPVEWIAPQNVRTEIAAAPALYKLYFTTSGAASEADGDANVGMKFAKEFLSAVNPILKEANGAVPDDFVPPKESTTAG